MLWPLLPRLYYVMATALPGVNQMRRKTFITTTPQRQYLRMFRRLPCLCNQSFSLVPRTTSTFPFSKAWDGLLSTARWRRSSQGRASSIYPYPIPIVRGKGPGVKVKPLSDQDFCGVVAKYFDTIISEVERAQKEGSSIALEHRVRSAQRKNALIPYNPVIHWSQEANRLISFQNEVLIIAAAGVGDYILKPQRSTEQIRLCSPISGSKSYDWGADSWKYYADDSNPHGIGVAQWVQLSTSTNLSDVLNKELGLQIDTFQIF